MTFVAHFNIGEMKYPGEMCYVNGNLVRSIHGVTGEKPIRVIHEETGSVLQEWNSCHVLRHLMVLQIKEKEYLLQGCTYCQVIRGYESPEASSNYKIFKKDIAPDAICKGPNGTVLIFENSSIKQFSFSDGYFHLADKFSFKLGNIRNMCYCEKYGIVIVLHEDRKSLTGVMLATGEVVWMRNEITFGSPPKSLQSPMEEFAFSTW